MEGDWRKRCSEETRNHTFLLFLIRASIAVENVEDGVTCNRTKIYLCSSDVSLFASLLAKNRVSWKKKVMAVCATYLRTVAFNMVLIVKMNTSTGNSIIPTR